MRIYKVLSVCGTGIATSTVASEKCREMLEERGISPIEVLECKVSEVLTAAESYRPDVIIHTAEIPTDALRDVKTFRAIQFLTGIGKEALADQIAEYLKSK
ncbi:MAG: MtlR transcriptional regulator [Eubacterium aggregans]|uniref:PTS sugar transporter subunit IIB n=1 Tax=Eubacterium aggregans TaxID=81409 RepID=UPI002B20AB0D|nr:MtlR transcriptional regulator [Eubacterium aggregans]MEA5073070.1 MtlR transcriptional regulator [Eubacterium aggregans]